jgi:hypothetical protein
MLASASLRDARLSHGDDAAAAARSKNALAVMTASSRNFENTFGGP